MDLLEENAPEKDKNEDSFSEGQPEEGNAEKTPVDSVPEEGTDDSAEGDSAEAGNKDEGSTEEKVESEGEDSEDSTVDIENTEPSDEMQDGEDSSLKETTEDVEAALFSVQTANGGDVSRAEWLAELVDVFEITVAEDNYPDNYYSDINASSPDYRTIMLATEFGLVDVEAGEAFRPDDAADREFAAHTLNYCLGFAPAEEENYTFSEAETVDYADDIQVAIERGWLSLTGGEFLPDVAITLAEKTAMLADARNVMASRKAGSSHNNSYTFAEGVIDLTGSEIKAELTDADVITFKECPVTLETGKKYGLEFDGFPMVFKTLTVTQSDEGSVVQFEAVPLEEAFTTIDMEGSMETNLAAVQTYSDDIELHYIVGGTEAEEWEDGTKYDTLEEVGSQEISAVEAVKTFALSDDYSKDITLAPGVKASVSCKVSDVKPNYDINLAQEKAHVGVDAKVIVNCNVSADAMEAAGISPKLHLIYIPIACIGSFTVDLNMKLSGEVTLSLVENVSLALYYENGGFRMQKEFSKDSFTLQTRVEISAEVAATLGMGSCNILKGELFAKFGAKNVLDSITYGDGKKPATCAHHGAWLFASAGGLAEIKMLTDSKSWSKTYDIYTEKNSPVRVSFHYEDGVAVPRCTRGTLYGPSGRKWGYYTSADSRYGYNGASQGIGANGEPYTVFEYTLDDANRATITKYQGNVSALSIPKTLDGHTVVGIGSNVFANNKLLRVVVVPDSVTEIGYNAFRDCVSLPSVALPDSITSMGTAVFYGCSSLQEAILPNGYINIPTETFCNCSSLEKVNFPDTLQAIRSYAFYNTKLSEIDLPENLTTIESYAFYNCNSLTKAVIPDSVTGLGSYLFADCEELSDVSLGTGITEIPSYAFYACPSLQKLVLPYRTMKIDSNAFVNCTSLTEITIPRATTSIANGVFSYPSRLTIYGIAGTYAETYANSIGATFVNQEKKTTEIKLSATDIKLVKGNTATLHLRVTPADFTDLVSWKSTNEKIVSVEDSGVVTAKAVGTATVKVTVGELSASCKVTVVQPVTSISLNKNSLSMEAWDTEKLTANVSPTTAENKSIVWTTSDQKVASMDQEGVVTAHAKGTATITVTAQDGSGISQSCAVTVVNNGYLCSSTDELESPHNYPVNCSDFWVYTKKGAESLYITFDSRTEVEEEFDFIYLYDGEKKQIGKYTGTQLAGQAVKVPGDTVKIKLVSDDGGTAWGFKAVYIMGTGDVENDEYLVTFDSQGGAVVSTAQVKRGTPVSKPSDPTRIGYEFLGWYLGDNLYDFTHPVNRNLVLCARWKYIVTEPELSDEEKVLKEDLPESGVVPEGLWIAGVADQVYTGKALKPEVRVYDGNRKLKEKADYTVSYKNNTKANDASDPKKAPAITVRGKGNYAGAATATFKINPVDLNEESVVISVDTLAYNKKVQQKAPTLTFNGKKMSTKRDYIVDYSAGESGAYQETGRYPIKVNGVGNFTGSKTVYLEITDKTLLSKVKSVKIPNQVYNGGEEIVLSQSALVLYMKSKNQPLVEGVDYTTAYENNREIGTAAVIVTGIGDYAGTKRLTFKITGTPIKKAVIEGITNKVYSGTEQQQNIIVRLDNRELVLDKDYKVIYNKNVNVGTASLTI